MNSDRDSGHTQIHFSPMVYEKVWFRSWKKTGMCRQYQLREDVFFKWNLEEQVQVLQNRKSNSIKANTELWKKNSHLNWLSHRLRVVDDCVQIANHALEHGSFFFFFLPVSKILRSFQSQLHSEETNLKVPHTLDMWQLLGEPQEVSLWTVRRWFLIGMFVRRGVTWRDQRRPQVTRSRLGIIRETRWVREYVGTLQEWN